MDPIQQLRLCTSESPPGWSCGTQGSDSIDPNISVSNATHAKCESEKHDTNKHATTEAVHTHTRQMTRCPHGTSTQLMTAS
jgi:hypothetical protein